MNNPFDVLGVDKNISDEDLKKTYKKLSFENHPDRNGGSQEATERFKKIQEAYNQVCDMRKNPGVVNAEFIDYSIDDLFEQLKFRHKQSRQPSLAISLSLKEIYNGTTITEKINKICPNCLGFKTAASCPVCSGAGKIWSGPEQFIIAPNAIKHNSIVKSKEGTIALIQIHLPEKYDKEIFYHHNVLQEEVFVDYPTLILGGQVKIQQFSTQKEVIMKIPPGTKLGQKFNVGVGLYNLKQICVVGLKYIENYTEEEKELLRKLQKE